MAKFAAFFGLFLWLQMAFPGDLVGALDNNTNHVPTIEGDFGSAEGMIFTFIMIFAMVMVVTVGLGIWNIFRTRQAKKDIQAAYGVSGESDEDETPMQYFERTTKEKRK